MKSLKELIIDPEKFAKDLQSRHKYVSKEFQDYGYRVALKLGDLKHVSMYIKWAKTKERAIMENALSFTVDYPNAKSKGRLFMWKVKQLEEERKEFLKDKKVVESDKEKESKTIDDKKD
jgi:hypothetical protein